MLYGTVAELSAAFLQLPTLPEVTVLGRADFVSRIYSWNDVAVDVSQVVVDPSRVTARGVEITVADGPVALTGNFLYYLLEVNFSAMLEIEIPKNIGHVLQMYPLTIEETGGGVYVFASCRNFSVYSEWQVSDSNDYNDPRLIYVDHDSGIDTGIHRIAFTRTGPRIEMSVDGGPATNYETMGFGVTPYVGIGAPHIPDAARLGGWSSSRVGGAQAQPHYIRSLRIYEPIDFNKLPYVSRFYHNDQNIEFFGDSRLRVRGALRTNNRALLAGEGTLQAVGFSDTPYAILNGAGSLKSSAMYRGYLRRSFDGVGTMKAVPKGNPWFLNTSASDNFMLSATSINADLPSVRPSQSMLLAMVMTDVQTEFTVSGGNWAMWAQDVINDGSGNYFSLGFAWCIADGSEVPAHFSWSTGVASHARARVLQFVGTLADATGNQSGAAGNTDTALWNYFGDGMQMTYDHSKVLTVFATRTGETIDTPPNWTSYVSRAGVQNDPGDMSYNVVGRGGGSLGTYAPAISSTFGSASLWYCWMLEIRRQM